MRRKFASLSFWTHYTDFCETFFWCCSLMCSCDSQKETCFHALFPFLFPSVDEDGRSRKDRGRVVAGSRREGVICTWHCTDRISFFFLMTDTSLPEQKKFNISVEFWLSHILLYFDTESNVLEAAPTHNSPVQNFDFSHLVTLDTQSWKERGRTTGWKR